MLPFRWTYKDFDQRDILIMNVIEKPGIAEELLIKLEKDEYLFGPIELLDMSISHRRDALYDLIKCKITKAWVRYVDRAFHKHVIFYYRSLWPDFYGFRLFFEPSHTIIGDLGLEIQERRNRKEIQINGKLLE